MNQHLATLFAVARKKPEAEPAGVQDSPAEEAGESPKMELSEVQLGRHRKVAHHLTLAMQMHAKGQHRGARVHVKLAQHHHNAAMPASMLKDSGGAPETSPGQPSEGEDYAS